MTLMILKKLYGKKLISNMKTGVDNAIELRVTRWNMIQHCKIIVYNCIILYTLLHCCILNNYE